MKFKRSERLIDMTNYLLAHPGRLVSLTFFAERYSSAKSSISEDLTIIKETFEQRGIGTLTTVPGAAGGVKYLVGIKSDEATAFIDHLCSVIASPERLLPGGYLYMTDILGHPETVNMIGRIIAAAYADKQVEVIMTMATKGIPLAYAVANYLNVPVVIVRRDNKVTEGPTVSINYVSGSSKRIQTMVLSKRSLAEGSKVLIVDDFMKAGGTVKGMVSLLEEFKATLAGITVFVESDEIEERLVDQFVSLIKLTEVDERDKIISVSRGNYLNNE
ncbi:pur operon repressor [Peribacillus loiseleuriae]|uniref:pur operon repressor n=1 Tax=Peribacillus loiseleuriae TaxID=1679170 RepID=UPI003CFD1229